MKLMMRFTSLLFALILTSSVLADQCILQNPKVLSDQVAIVWGASQGIGSAIAKRLAAEGAHVVILARNAEKLNNVAAEIRALGGSAEPIVADITDEAMVKALTAQIIEKHQRVDILVQNVGIYPRMPILETTTEFFKQVMDTNLTSCIHAIQAVLPAMKARNYGRILLVSSTTGNITGIPGLTAYSASKGAITGLTKTLAIEIAPFGITVNSVQPGYILTGPVDAYGSEYKKKVEDSIPVGRMGSPEEVASISFFMVHPDASYVTGTSVVIDGGLTLPESHFLHVVKRP